MVYTALPDTAWCCRTKPLAARVISYFLMHCIYYLFLPFLSHTPLDINECAIDMDNCNDNALCTDTMGSFICGCVDGFRGDGVTCTGEWVKVYRQVIIG